MEPITHTIQIKITEKQLSRLQELCKNTWFNDSHRQTLDIPEVIEMMMDDLINKIRELKQEYRWRDEDGFSKKIAAQYIRKFYQDVEYLDDFIQYLDNEDELVETATTLILYKREAYIMQRDLESLSTGWRYYSTLQERKLYWYFCVDQDGAPLYPTWEDFQKNMENSIVESREETREWADSLHVTWMEFYDSREGEYIRSKVSRDQFKERSPWLHCLDHVREIYYHPEIEENQEMAAQYKSFAKPL